MNVCFKALGAGVAICCTIGLITPIAQAASLSSADQTFMVSTARGATYELAMAKLALAKATRSDIKSYAHTMISDHESLNPELHQIAQAQRRQSADHDDRKQAAIL